MQIQTTPWEVRREKWRCEHDKEWFCWFAWYPVKTEDDKWVWLEWVEKRYWDGMTYNMPDYRLPR